tara:strand:- start:1719 stop:2000 length:282 start_codon:yes stop_codon:yes gene_type:complete
MRQQGGPLISRKLRSTNLYNQMAMASNGLKCSSHVNARGERMNRFPVIVWVTRQNLCRKKGIKKRIAQTRKEYRNLPNFAKKKRSKNEEMPKR